MTDFWRFQCKVSYLEVCHELLAIGDDKGNLTCWQWKTGITNIIKLASSGVMAMQFEDQEGLLAVG